MNRFFDSPLATFRLISSPHLVVQWRFPRSKRRRIRNKWINNPHNFRPDTRLFIADDTVTAHPATIARLQAEQLAAGIPLSPGHFSGV